MAYEPRPQKPGTTGLAFLLTNCNSSPKHEFLSGTIHDHDNWMRALTELNFDVRWERNLDEKLMKAFLATASGTRVNGEYVIIVFSGHGKEGFLYSQDGKRLSLKEDIFPNFFKGTMFSLHKLFFLDACRSNKEENDLCTQNMFPNWQDGSGRYLAFFPVALGQATSDYNEGSPFAKAVTSAIVQDKSLLDVIESTMEEMSEKSKSERLQPGPQTLIRTLEGISKVNLRRLKVDPLPRPPQPPTSNPDPEPVLFDPKYVFKKYDWRDLKKDVKDMLTRERVELLAKQYDLINEAHKDAITGHIGNDDYDRAASCLLEYFEKNRNGLDLLEFCKFLRDEARAAGWSVPLTRFADKLENLVKYGKR